MMGVLVMLQNLNKALQTFSFVLSVFLSWF